jgi:hypothetical protein
MAWRCRMAGREFLLMRDGFIGFFVRHGYLAILRNLRRRSTESKRDTHQRPFPTFDDVFRYVVIVNTMATELLVRIRQTSRRCLGKEIFPIHTNGWRTTPGDQRRQRRKLFSLDMHPLGCDEGCKAMVMDESWAAG